MLNTATNDDHLMLISYKNATERLELKRVSEEGQAALILIVLCQE